MRQGWKSSGSILPWALMAALAVAHAAVAVAPAGAARTGSRSDRSAQASASRRADPSESPVRDRSDAASKPGTTRPARPRVGLHQFTGFLSTFDKTSLTVEKRGRKPRTMVLLRTVNPLGTNDGSRAPLESKRTMQG